MEKLVCKVCGKTAEELLLLGMLQTFGAKTPGTKRADKCKKGTHKFIDLNKEQTTEKTT